jgi:hypothetical protein
MNHLEHFANKLLKHSPSLKWRLVEPPLEAYELALEVYIGVEAEELFSIDNALLRTLPTSVGVNRVLSMLIQVS